MWMKKTRKSALNSSLAVRINTSTEFIAVEHLLGLFTFHELS